MLSVTELLDKAIECDRLAGLASRPNGQAHNQHLAACYRYLAEQAEMVVASVGDVPITSREPAASTERAEAP